MPCEGFKLVPPVLFRVRSSCLAFESDCASASSPNPSRGRSLGGECSALAGKADDPCKCYRKLPCLTDLLQLARVDVT
jgi:hypothetical protein